MRERAERATDGQRVQRCGSAALKRSAQVVGVLSALLMSSACAEPEPAPEIVPAPIEVPAVQVPVIEGTLSFSLNGEDRACTHFPPRGNTLRPDAMRIRCATTLGSGHELGIQVRNFDLRQASLPVTIGAGALAEAEVAGSARGPRVALEYFQNGDSYTTDAGTLVIESFEDGLIVGHVLPFAASGSGLANGQVVQIGEVRFGVTPIVVDAAGAE